MNACQSVLYEVVAEGVQTHKVKHVATATQLPHERRLRRVVIHRCGLVAKVAEVKLTTGCWGCWLVDTEDGKVIYFLSMEMTITKSEILVGWFEKKKKNAVLFVWLGLESSALDLWTMTLFAVEAVQS